MGTIQKNHLIALLVLFSVFSSISGQNIKENIDSLNVKFGVLLKKDVEAAGLLADSLLRASEREAFIEGVISSSLMKAKYQRKLGNYDSAASILTSNLSFIQEKLDLISEDYQIMVWRTYGVSYYDLAVISYYKGNYNEALANTLLSDSIQDQFFKGKDFGQERYLNSKRTAKMLRGNIYSVRGEIDRAIEMFEEGAAESEAVGKFYNAAVTYLNLGTLYKDKGRLIDAINVLKRAQRLAEEHEYASLTASVIGAIGQVFYSMQDYEEALNFSMKAYRLHESLEDKFSTAYTAADVGDYYKELNLMDSAIWYYEKSLNLHEEMGNMDDVAYVLERLAGLKSEVGACSEALEFENKGLAIVQEYDLPKERLLLSVVRAECALKIGRLDEAIEVTDWLLKMSEETQNIRHQKDIYHIAHRVYQSIGNDKKAYAYLAKFLQLRDSIYTEEKAMEVARAEYQYELDKERSRSEEEKRRQQLVYEQKLARERWIKFGITGFSIFILFIAISIYRAYQIKRNSNVQLTEKNKRLKELREREQELSEEALSARERELATMAMATLEKNNLLNDLEQKVSFIENRMTDDLKPSLKEMRKAISDSYSLDKSWDSFIHRFEDVHPQFFDKLKSDNTSLTVEDLKLSAYLKIGMSNKEIANVTHLTLGSVKSKINRLKKKLELNADDSVRDFILKYA
ncbi:tetratricopeptide repeat protein [Ekhidna sp.]